MSLSEETLKKWAYRAEAVLSNRPNETIQMQSASDRILFLIQALRRSEASLKIATEALGRISDMKYAQGRSQMPGIFLEKAMEISKDALSKIKGDQ